MQEKRKNKICSLCRWNEPETVTLEGECEIEEDRESEEFCDGYERRRDD